MAERGRTVTTEKKFIDAQELMEDSIRLGIQVLQSGFRPNFIVGVWRGGTPVGIVVQELLDFYGVKTDHIAIRTSSYSAVGKRESQVRVHGLSYLIKNINAEDTLLIVDDVYECISNRRTIKPSGSPITMCMKQIAGWFFLMNWTGSRWTRSTSTSRG